MKNYFKLAIKFQIRRKETIFNIIFISLTAFLILGFSSYYLSSQEYLKNDIYDVKPYRKLDVQNDINIELEETDKEYINLLNKELNRQKEELRNIPHVTNVVNTYAERTILTVNDFKINNLNGEIEVNSSNNDSLPEIVYGTNFPDEDGNYMVCPENFYPTDAISYKNLSIFNKIKIKDFLNKTITSNYQSSFQTETYSIDYKIVEFYKNNKTHFDENICYVTNNSMMEIINNYYSDDIDVIRGVNNIIHQTTLTIEIDNLENMEFVKSQLDNLGYGYKEIAYIDEAWFKEIHNNVVKYIYIALIISFVLLFIVFIKELKEDISNYKLLSILGYSKKNIKAIFIISAVIQFIFSLILSLLLLVILYGLAILILYCFPFIMNKWTLYINYSSILLVVPILFASTIINILIGAFTIDRKLV